MFGLSRGNSDIDGQDVDRSGCRDSFALKAVKGMLSNIPLLCLKPQFSETPEKVRLNFCRNLEFRLNEDSGNRSHDRLEISRYEALIVHDDTSC